MKSLDLSTPMAAGALPPSKTIVGLLLDKSGSMGPVKGATIDAYNEYINTLKKDANILFTFVQFCSESVRPVVVRQPIGSVPPLNAETYRPEQGGMTPLRDATAQLIRGMEQQARDLGGNVKVVIAVQTDGLENASREIGGPQLKSMIEEKQAAGWQFNFLGAGLEEHAYIQASGMGIGRGQTVSYDHRDAAKTRSVFADTAMNTMTFASGLSASTGYSNAQKFAAGDVVDGKPNVTGHVNAHGKLADLAKVTGWQATANPKKSQKPSRSASPAS